MWRIVERGHTHFSAVSWVCYVPRYFPYIDNYSNHLSKQFAMNLGCGSLSAVSIPTSVSYIGDYAFCGYSHIVIFGFFFLSNFPLECSRLTAVVIPTTVQYLGIYSFFGLNLIFYFSSLLNV